MMTDEDTFEKRFRDLRQRHSRSRKHIFYLALVTIALFIVILLCLLLKGRAGYVLDYELLFHPKEAAFVVNTKNCRILDYNPFNEDVDRYKAQMKYSIDDRPGSCQKLPLLSSVTRSGSRHVLHLHKEHFIRYTQYVENVTCCYSYLFSSALLYGEEENATVDEPKFMHCKKFTGDVKMELDFDFVQVKCGNNSSQEEPPSNLYQHFHSFVSVKREVRVKMDLYNETIRLGRKFENDTDLPPWEKPWSVMIIGLDSVSRLNLLRTMPKTVDYLDRKGWYGFKGHNKVGENTFPNLAAAVMAGSTEKQLRKTCAPRKETPVDWCPWVWGRFASQGYITAYGEDQTKMDTFYEKMGGFRHPPTDYFLRTLLKAAEDSSSHDWFAKLSQYYDCVGRKHEAQYIVDFSLEYAEALKFYPTFSLWWFNSFSHERLFGPKPMDDYFKSYLENMTRAVNDTIIFFMSDHGMNHGFYRQTNMGYIEDNMPFLYMWLPPSFKMLNSKPVANLIENQHKLTSHYDVHMTLLDLLNDGSKAPGCPKCHSLFQRVADNRTCADAGIPLRYCACTPYSRENEDSYKHLGEFMVKEINAFMKPLQQYTFEEFTCANFTLGKVNSVKRLIQTNQPPKKTKEELFVVAIETKPEALFEALIKFDEKVAVNVVDRILRQDSYENESRCMTNTIGRPYCICQPKIDFMERIMEDEKKIERKIEEQKKFKQAMMAKQGKKKHVINIMKHHSKTKQATKAPMLPTLNASDYGFDKNDETTIKDEGTKHVDRKDDVFLELDQTEIVEKEKVERKENENTKENSSKGSTTSLMDDGTTLLGKG